MFQFTTAGIPPKDFFEVFECVCPDCITKLPLKDMVVIRAGFLWEGEPHLKFAAFCSMRCLMQTAPPDGSC